MTMLVNGRLMVAEDVAFRVPETVSTGMRPPVLKLWLALLDGLRVGVSIKHSVRAETRGGPRMPRIHSGQRLRFHIMSGRQAPIILGSGLTTASLESQRNTLFRSLTISFY